MKKHLASRDSAESSQFPAIVVLVGVVQRLRSWVLKPEYRGSCPSNQLLEEWSWASCSTSLFFNFLIFKIRTLTVTHFMEFL